MENSQLFEQVFYLIKVVWPASKNKQLTIHYIQLSSEERASNLKVLELLHLENGQKGGQNGQYLGMYKFDGVAWFSP